MQHWAVVHLEVQLAKVMTSAHTVWLWWEENFENWEMHSRTKNLDNIPNPLGHLHVCSKINAGSGFPRLLRFQELLGCTILDVNSCSNLAFTDQDQCQGWPSEPRWQQVALTENLLGKQALKQRLTVILLSFSFAFVPPPHTLFHSLLFWCLTWKSSEVTDVHFSLIHRLFPTIPAYASESVSPLEEAE